jgi:hypothetical protein
MPPFVVLFIAYTCEDPLAKLAHVRLLASVGPQMDHEVSLL